MAGMYGSLVASPGHDMSVVPSMDGSCLSSSFHRRLLSSGSDSNFLDKDDVPPRTAHMYFQRSVETDENGSDTSARQSPKTKHANSSNDALPMAGYSLAHSSSFGRNISTASFSQQLSQRPDSSLSELSYASFLTDNVVSNAKNLIDGRAARNGTASTSRFSVTTESQDSVGSMQRISDIVRSPLNETQAGSREPDYMASPGHDSGGSDSNWSDMSFLMSSLGLKPLKVASQENGSAVARASDEKPNTGASAADLQSATGAKGRDDLKAVAEGWQDGKTLSYWSLSSVQEIESASNIAENLLQVSKSRRDLMPPSTASMLPSAASVPATLTRDATAAASVAASTSAAPSAPSASSVASPMKVHVEPTPASNGISTPSHMQSNHEGYCSSSQKAKEGKQSTNQASAKEALPSSASSSFSSRAVAPTPGIQQGSRGAARAMQKLGPLGKNEKNDSKPTVTRLPTHRHVASRYLGHTKANAGQGSATSLAAKRGQALPADKSQTAAEKWSSKVLLGAESGGEWDGSSSKQLGGWGSKWLAARDNGNHSANQHGSSQMDASVLKFREVGSPRDGREEAGQAADADSIRDSAGKGPGGGSIEQVAAGNEAEVMAPITNLEVRGVHEEVRKMSGSGDDGIGVALKGVGDASKKTSYVEEAAAVCKEEMSSPGFGISIQAAPVAIMASKEQSSVMPAAADEREPRVRRSEDDEQVLAQIGELLAASRSGRGRSTEEWRQATAAVLGQGGGEVGASSTERPAAAEVTAASAQTTAAWQEGQRDVNQNAVLQQTERGSREDGSAIDVAWNGVREHLIPYWSAGREGWQVKLDVDAQLFLRAAHQTPQRAGSSGEANIGDERVARGQTDAADVAVAANVPMSPAKEELSATAAAIVGIEKGAVGAEQAAGVADRSEGPDEEESAAVLRRSTDSSGSMPPADVETLRQGKFDSRHFSKFVCPIFEATSPDGVSGSNAADGRRLVSWRDSWDDHAVESVRFSTVELAEGGGARDRRLSVGEVSVEGRRWMEERIAEEISARDEEWKQEVEKLLGKVGEEQEEKNRQIRTLQHRVKELAEENETLRADTAGAPIAGSAAGANAGGMAGGGRETDRAGELVEMRQREEETRSQLQVVEEEKKRLEERVKEITDERDEAMKRVEEALKQKVENEKATTGVDAHHAQEEMARIKDDMSKATARMRRVDSEMKKLRAANGELMSQKLALEDLLRQEKDERVADMEALTQDMNVRVARCSEMMEEKRREVEVLSLQIASLKQENGSLEVQLETAKEDAERARREMETFMGQVQQLEQSIKQQVAAVKQFQASEQSLSRALEVATQGEAAAKKELELVKRQQSNSETAEVDSLRRVVAEKESERRDLEQLLEKLRGERDAQWNETQNLKRLVRQREFTIEDYEQRMERAERRMEETEQSAAKLKSDLNVAVKKREGLEREVRQLKVRLVELEGTIESLEEQVSGLIQANEELEDKNIQLANDVTQFEEMLATRFEHLQKSPFSRT